MLSERNVLETYNRMFPSVQIGSVKAKKVAELLNDAGRTHGVSLTPYGFILWALEQAGTAMVYKNALLSPKYADGYASHAAQCRDDMPALLVNASKYLQSVFDTVQDPLMCLKRLEDMTTGYILCLLFSVVGQKDFAKRYRSELREHLLRYPSSLDKLPDSFKKVGKEALNAGAE